MFTQLCTYIYIYSTCSMVHNWVIFWVNVGKYSSTMVRIWVSISRQVHTPYIILIHYNRIIQSCWLSYPRSPRWIDHHRGQKSMIFPYRISHDFQVTKFSGLHHDFHSECQNYHGHIPMKFIIIHHDSRPYSAVFTLFSIYSPFEGPSIAITSHSHSQIRLLGAVRGRFHGAGGRQLSVGVDQQRHATAHCLCFWVTAVRKPWAKAEASLWVGPVRR